MADQPAFAYAQARLQARYSQRVDDVVWLRLRNIHDLASYLQVAQQTALRPWVLGISAGHSSHDIELALRQKFRGHVDEVAHWLPTAWQIALQWIKRLADLPLLQYLLAGGTALGWMRSDPAVSQFTDEDPALRSRAMLEAGYADLVNAWQMGESLFSGWLSHWNRIRPHRESFNHGLKELEKLLQKQMLLLATQKEQLSQADFADVDEKLRRIFRRYAFQPAAVCAYLALIAIDLQQLRSDLLQRLFFLDVEMPAEGFAA
ncbi:MAG: hypothetical protein ABFR19_01440 [Pseudomonadota bacterium]